jgi:hypothetical protein
LFFSLKCALSASSAESCEEPALKQREIRADYDGTSIVMYQAYREQITRPALASQRFVPPFSLNRMTWIKPSFLWMMERSNWARKPGQEYVLAVRITRAGWDEALANAILTSPERGVYSDAEEWRRQFEQAPVIVQWDPERSLRGAAPQIDSIQVGLGRRIIERYVNDWTREIRDLTPLVRKLRDLIAKGRADQAQKLLPRERVYPVEERVARRLGMEA